MESLAPLGEIGGVSVGPLLRPVAAAEVLLLRLCSLLRGRAAPPPRRPRAASPSQQQALQEAGGSHRFALTASVTGVLLLFMASWFACGDRIAGASARFAETATLSNPDLIIISVPSSEALKLSRLPAVAPLRVTRSRGVGCAGPAESGPMGSSPGRAIRLGALPPPTLPATSFNFPPLACSQGLEW